MKNYSVFLIIAIPALLTIVGGDFSFEQSAYAQTGIVCNSSGRVCADSHYVGTENQPFAVTNSFRGSNAASSTAVCNGNPGAYTPHNGLLCAQSHPGPSPMRPEK